MRAKHIKRGFKKFGGWVKKKTRFILYDPKLTTFVNGEIRYLFRGEGE